MSVKFNELLDHFLQGYENGNINDPDFQTQATINMPSLAKDYRKAINALLVIANDNDIKEYLQANDPKAYQQVVDAIQQ